MKHIYTIFMILVLGGAVGVSLKAASVSTPDIVTMQQDIEKEKEKINEYQQLKSLLKQRDAAIKSIKHSAASQLKNLENKFNTLLNTPPLNQLQSQLAQAQTQQEKQTVLAQIKSAKKDIKDKQGNNIDAIQKQIIALKQKIHTDISEKIESINQQIQQLNKTINEKLQKSSQYVKTQQKYYRTLNTLPAGEKK